MATATSAHVARRAGWDPLVRLTHWGIAAAVLLNGIVTEEGGSAHTWVGYAAFALLALRLVWGIIGPDEARFASFPPSPSRAIAHVRDILAGRHTSHRSHNPLGTLMVYALWATLAAVTVTGIAMVGSPFEVRREARAETIFIGSDHGERGEYGEEEHEGAGGERGEVLEEVHEVAANLLFMLAALHVAGVAFETTRTGSGILTAMVTGRGKEGRRA